jgi:hydroxymethylpyrimidine/phosphomethylpyrimidine kinase
MTPSAAPVPGGGVPFARRPAILCLAGIDPSGGAGLARDVMVVDRLGAHPLPVPTALTVQNTQDVLAVVPIPGDTVASMARAVLDDFPVHAVKVGMLASEDVVAQVAELLRDRAAIPVVVDPVLRSTSGCELLSSQGLLALKDCLLPEVTVLTPNRQEAETLVGIPIATVEDLREAARRLCQAGVEWAYIKAPDLPGGPLDVLQGQGTCRLYPGEPLHSNRVHGTGCVFSAALACFLGTFLPVPQAAARAKQVAEATIRTASRIGRGMALPGRAELTAYGTGGDTR